LRLAALLPRTGDVAGGRAIIEEMLKLDPKDKDALATLAGIEEAAERWEEASAALRRLVAVEEGVALVDAALRLADACEHAGRPGDARGGLERARLAEPRNEPLRRRLERVYSAIGAFHELAEMSLEDARASLDVSSRFTNLVRAGAYFLQQGEPDAAVAPLEEARALRPGDNECILYLADTYTILERHDHATELLGSAVAAHKGRRSRELAALYHRLARLAQICGDGAGLMNNLATALDMDAQNGAVASELAVVAMHYGNLEVAARALRAITMMKAPAPMAKGLAYQHLGEIAHHQGDKKRALLMLKRAVDEDATLTSARAMLEALQAE
jgi:tetratricopeptide (TPR) repeat protein